MSLFKSIGGILNEPNKKQDSPPKSSSSLNDGFSVSKVKKQTSVDEKHIENANQIISEFEDTYKSIVEHTKDFFKGTGPKDDDNEAIFDNLESFYKALIYRQIIAYHLNFAIYAQPGLLSTIFSVCDKEGKGYLKELISFSSLKPLLSYTFDKLISPIAQGGDEKSLAQKYSSNMPAWNRDFTMDVSELAYATPEKLISNFMNVARFFQTSFFVMSANSGWLKSLLENPEECLKRLPTNYDKTWVSTCLLHGLNIAKGLGYENFNLEEYPNQGRNIAIQVLLFMHQQNRDVDSNGNVLMRYPVNNIGRISNPQAQMMVAQAGAIIFEDII